MAVYAKPFADFRVTSKYGMRALAGGTFHEGQDYGVPMNTPLPALEDGVVVQVGESKKFGKFAVIKSKSGLFYRWHAANLILVKVGQTVTRGQTVALSGMSGFWSTGPHGHLQITRTLSSDTHIDPASVLVDLSPEVASVSEAVQIQEEEPMYKPLLVSTPSAAGGNFVDWYVVNYGDHTYYHVPNDTQKDFLRNAGRVEFIGDVQAGAILAGFKLI